MDRFAAVELAHGGIDRDPEAVCLALRLTGVRHPGLTGDIGGTCASENTNARLTVQIHVHVDGAVHAGRTCPAAYFIVAAAGRVHPLDMPYDAGGGRKERPAYGRACRQGHRVVGGAGDGIVAIGPALELRDHPACLIVLVAHLLPIRGIDADQQARVVKVGRLGGRTARPATRRRWPAESVVADFGYFSVYAGNPARLSEPGVVGIEGGMAQAVADRNQVALRAVSPRYRVLASG